MRFKTTLAALALAALPAAALAEGCGWKHMNDTAASCPDGTVFDSGTGACVKQTTS